VGFDTQDGITILQEPNQIYIAGNRIYDNAGLGISFTSGGVPLPNDSGDLDSGQNGMQNFPILDADSGAILSGGQLHIRGGLSTKQSGGLYTIHFYASPVANTTGFGEGSNFVGSAQINVGATGFSPIDVTLPTTVSGGQFLTATATDANLNTSEFSNAVQIQGAKSTFPQKGISDIVQQQVPGGNGSLHSVNGNARSNLQPQNVALPQSALATGDGNGDGIQDYLQPNVVSFPGISGKWITLASPAGTALENVVPSGPPDFAPIPSGYTFPLGFVSFSVTGLTPGGTVTVTNFFHDEIDFDIVFAYGPTPGIPQPHWYDLGFEGAGAQLDLNGFTLTFLDGDAGDHDLQANGTITTILAAAHKIPPGPRLVLVSTQVGQASVLDVTQDAQGNLTLVTNVLPVVSSVLSWPASAANYALYYKDALTSSDTLPNPNSFSFFNSWLPVSDPLVVVNGQNILTNTATSAARFFQLRPYPISATPTFTGPTLQVVLLPDYFVRLTWPASAAGYGLEFADQLSPITPWQRVADPPSAVGSQNTLTLDAAASPTRFYRLRKF